MICRKLILCLRMTALLLSPLVLVVSCEKPASFNRAIGLQSRYVILPAENGITPVIVYSNTSWQASFNPPVSWAALDRLSDTGDAEVRLAYASNYGRARWLRLRLVAGGQTDTVRIVQRSGISEERLEVVPSVLDIAAADTQASVALDTNITENLQEIVIETDYASGPAGWISSATIVDGRVQMTLEPNLSGQDRAATVSLCHTDAFGVKLQAWITLNQTGL